MKQDKGITLITLIMYIILTLVVLGILGMLSRNFRSNLNNVNVKTAQDVEFDKLNVQLLKETKTENNFIETATATKASITFANGNKYTYSDAEEAVFLNDNIKIAENIKSCAFSVENTDTEQVLKVRTLIGDKGQITEYVMKKKVAVWEHHDWHYIDETTRAQIRCTCSKCVAFDDGDSTGRTLSIGQQIGETETKTASTSITAAKSGYTSDQTLTLNAEETKWVVFGYEDKDGDGANEVLLITTEKATMKNVTFTGYENYNNGIVEINRICEELYGTNARGITIEDLNRTLGYTPAGGMYYYNDQWYTTGNFATKLKDIKELWNSIYNHFTEEDSDYHIEPGVFYDPSNPEGIKDNGATLGNYIINGYCYMVLEENELIPGISVSKEIASNVKKMVFGNNNNYSYWLASRGISTRRYYIPFTLGLVWRGIAETNDCWCDSYGVGTGVSSNHIRPLVSLTSDIPAAGNILEFLDT